MSWLGESLNSLTGQISNFTREVLTEGTEEVSDHATELNVCKDQVQDLSNQCNALRQEVERVRLLNAELEEKSQSAELQIAAISSEYRALLDKKDGELNFLKKQRNELQQVTTTSDGTHGPLEHAFFDSRIADRSATCDDIIYQSDYFDYSDVIESGPNINQPSARNSRATLSGDVYSCGLQQAKNQASSQNDLLKRIAELESKLSYEVDQHQNELTTLQDFHEQKYSKLKEQYDDEIAKLQSSLSFYDKHSESTSNDPSSASLNEVFLASTTEIENLKKELLEKETSNEENARTIQLLNRQLNQTQSEKNALENRIQEIKEEHESLINANSDMKHRIDSLNQIARDNEAAQSELTHENQKEVCEAQTVSTETEETFLDFQEKDALIESFQKRAESIQQDLENLKTAHNQMESQTSHLLTENEALKNEHHVLKSKIENKNQEVEALQNENSLLQQNLEELDSQHEISIEQLLSSQAAVIEQNKALQEQLKSHKAKHIKENVQEKPSSSLFPLSLLEEQLDPEIVNRIAKEGSQVTFESIVNILSALHSETLALENSRNSILVESEEQTVSLRKELEVATSENADLIQNTVGNDEALEAKRKEIGDLKEEICRLETTLASSINQNEDFFSFKKKMKGLENDLSDANTEIQRLKIFEAEKEEILSQFRSLQSEYNSINETVIEKNQIIEEFELTRHQSNKLEGEVAELKLALTNNMDSTEQVENLKSDLLVYLKQIENLNHQYNARVKECEALRLKVKDHTQSEASKDLQRLNSPSKSIEDELATDDDQCRIASQVSEGSSGGSDFEIVSKDDGSDHSSTSKEFERVENKESADIGEDLSQLLLQKDNEIKELQEKIIYMSQQLLDCQSPTADNSPDFEGSTLEEQIKNLNFEKEQILSVMSEKLKECSSLKAENHQLMNIISAEKQAMSKLQQDNEELTKLQKEHSDPELTKEAIQNLSRLVRDKDVEIEALCKKNDTLAEMSQANSAIETQNLIKVLLEEKENLLREKNVNMSNQEQILNALHQKHQESLNYHSELQRIQGLLSEENQKYDTLDMKHKSVCEKYEGKQKTLMDVQNELILLKQKYSSLEQEQSDLKSNLSSVLEKNKTEDNTVKVEKKLWTLKNEECFNLKKSLDNQDKMMNEKDLMIHAKSSKIKELEEVLTKKDDEIQVLNVNRNNATLQNKNLEDELATARSLSATADSSVDNIKTECNMMKEMTTKLTMAIKEKEFEVQSLTTKISTLEKLLEEKSSDDEKLAKLLKDNETIRNLAQTLQHERDQAMLALQQCKQEVNLLQNQLCVIGDRENKLIKELERLRVHLVQVEESYTKEAIHAEEREKELRNRLAVADEKAESSTNSFHSANHQATLQVESLKEQLHSLADQRDNALLQLSNSEAQVQQLNTSLNNLQLVLEKFQQEKFQDIEIVKRQMSNMIQEEKVKGIDLSKEMNIKEARLKEAVEALSAASRLSEQLDKKEEAISSLKAEVNRKDDELQKAVKQIQAFTSNNGGKVDKAIMKNLVLGYFSTPLDKRQEVVRLLASILDFNQQEVQKVGLDHNKKNSWLSWLGRAEATNEKHSTSSEKSSNNDSFSEAFVQFLQMESQPQIQIKLPAEQMARELTQKSKNFSKEPTHLKPLRINPFTASVAQMSPTQKTSSSHLLMKPISASLPTFTPLPVSETTTTNILKDVLKQE